MKKIVVLLIASVMILFLFSCNRENLIAPLFEPKPDLFTDIDTTLKIQTTQEGNLTIYKIDRYNTIVVKIPHISSYLYLQRPEKTLEQIAADSNYTLIVNASYFDFAYDDTVARTGFHYKHAGYLKINNSVYEGIKDDRQLSRLFAYSSKYNSVNYFAANELSKTKNYDLVFQTGPQIIRKNEIDNVCIDSSINGHIRWQRTAFASVDGKEFYIIAVVGDQYNYGAILKDLGKMLRSSGIFRKELSLINLDGGFSTSLYIKNHPEFSFRVNFRRPLTICVK